VEVGSGAKVVPVLVGLCARGEVVLGFCVFVVNRVLCFCLVAHSAVAVGGDANGGKRLNYDSKLLLNFAVLGLSMVREEFE
jgi:hypothetical protein